MNNKYTTPTEYRELFTTCGFRDVTIVEHTRKGEIEIKIQKISKQDLVQLSDYINSVKPAGIRVTITETNPDGDVSEHTYDTAAVMSENEMGTENIDINIGGSQKSEQDEKMQLENISQLFYGKQKRTHEEETLSDVKEKYVNGEISMLEFEARLEKVLDPEPIAID